MSETLEQRLGRVKERDIEKKVCDYARGLGFRVYKFQSPNHASVPDRIFINPDGLVFFIEFKALGKQLTPAQARECHRLGDQGCHVYIIDDVEKGKRLVNLIADSERFVAETVQAAEEFSALLSGASRPARH